jgi:hypothetical protein
LYPEVSQLLNDAQRNYNDGVSLIKFDSRDSGMQKFAIAREKTREVKLMFPVNQEAGMLELKINQVIDPNAFEETFRQRFITAVAGAKRGSMESYIDLENLSSINPKYSGIQAALAEAKYDVGLMPRPIDTKIINNSNDLARRAQQLLAGNVRSQYAGVLDLVNQALQLNPNNALAMQIKDRVQLAIGSGNVVVSDQATEQEYLRAVREFQQGNNILALSIVRRLLQNQNNKNDERINALYKRISATM